MSYLDFWKFSGGDSYLSHEDDDDYIAHYGVKGMKWNKHKYKTVSPDGSYEYGNLLTRGQVTGSNQNTYNKKAVVNPNAKRFGVSLHSESRDVNYRVNGKSMGTRVAAKNDAYLKVNYNKDRIDRAKAAVNNARNKAERKVKYGVNLAKSGPSGIASQIKSKREVKKHYQQVRDKVATNNRVYEAQRKKTDSEKLGTKIANQMEKDYRREHPTISKIVDKANKLKRKFRR